MSLMLCWHRGKAHGRYYACIHCGVSVEECPCACFRAPQGSCPCCSGSGWVSIVRGHLAKFMEYLDRHEERLGDGW